jgi:hypothetical protein
MFAALARKLVPQSSSRPFQAMGAPKQEDCATSRAMSHRAQQVQLDSTQRRRMNLNAWFNAPQVAETLLELVASTAEINGLDVLIAEILEDMEKEKNPR